MAEQSGFFDAHLTGGEYDRVYLASSFARYFASFIGNGVFADKAAGLMVYQTNPSTMGVKILPGQAWINGYWYENDSEFSVPIDIADGVLNRIDLVVLRWGTVERSINLVVKKGTPALNAVAPVVQRDSDYYELKLAEIHVTAGSTSITQANIVDTRADTNTCGWVTSIIEQVDTSELFAQWQAAYEAAYATTQTYLSEQKAAWERFFENATEDSVFPVPALEDAGKVPAVNGDADGYVLQEFLSLLGGTLKGNVSMGGNSLAGLPTPVLADEAVPKAYVDNGLAGKAPSGYGLGSVSNDLSTKWGNDANNATACGWYGFSSQAVNTPFPYGVILTSNRLGVGGLQLAFSHLRDGYNHEIMALRSKMSADGDWLSWKYINPPMHSDVEYRTTDRLNNIAVIKKYDSASGKILYRLDTTDGERTWQDYHQLMGAEPVKKLNSTSLAGAGWYRIGEIRDYASFRILLSTVYGATPDICTVIDVHASFMNPVLNKTSIAKSSTTSALPIDQVRLVKSSENTHRYFVDFHYNVSGTNSVLYYIDGCEDRIEEQFSEPQLVADGSIGGTVSTTLAL